MLLNNKRDISLLNIRNGGILIIVPHADDDLIGCFSIINKQQQVYAYYIGEYSIKNVILSRRRDEEFKNFANSFNLTIIGKESANHIDNIKSAIIDNDIQTVITPDFNDWHSDHQQASLYVIEALSTLKVMPDILTYSITVPKPFFKKVLIAPLNKELQKKKWDAFKQFYKSQNFMPVKRFMLQERLNAVGVSNAYAAELFTSFTYAEFCDSYRIRPTNETQIHIKGLINNIEAIRRFSDTCFQ